MCVQVVCCCSFTINKSVDTKGMGWAAVQPALFSGKRNFSYEICDVMI